MFEAHKEDALFLLEGIKSLTGEIQSARLFEMKSGVWLAALCPNWTYAITGQGMPSRDPNRRSSVGEMIGNTANLQTIFLANFDSAESLLRKNCVIFGSEDDESILEIAKAAVATRAFQESLRVIPRRPTK